MYSDLKERIIPLLPNLDSPPCKEILSILDEYELKMKGCICWSTEDVINRAKEAYKIVLSEDSAQTIVEAMIDDHDCNYGITWDSVDSAVWDHMQEHERDHYNKLRDFEIAQDARAEIEEGGEEEDENDSDPTEGVVRAGKCPVTGTLVLQEYTSHNGGEGEWLCLHNDTIEEDEQKVEHFNKTGEAT